MKYARKIISVFLLAAIVLSMMATAVVPTTYADSTSRIQTFLKMAAGAELTNEDVSGLTMDQLVFLGVYLSNFYQPFGTEFGQGDDEIAENCRADMIEALQTKLAFSDEMAESLVEIILQMTRQTVQYLDVYIKDGDNYVNMNEYIYANYYNFLRMMVGNSGEVVEGFKGQMGGQSFPFMPDWDRNCFDLLVKIYQNELGTSNTVDPKWYFSNSSGGVSSQEDCPQSDWSWYRTIDWAALHSPYIMESNGDISDTWMDSNILTNRRNVSYITSASGYSSVVDDVITADPELFIRTLYLYQFYDYTFKVHHPYIDSTTDDYSRSFNKEINSSGVTISYYAYNVYGEGILDTTYYWSATDLSDSATVSINKVATPPPTSGSSFTKVGSTAIVVDPVKWEECRRLAMLMSEEPDYYYFGYEKNGETKIVYNCASTRSLADGKNYTASQQQFMKCLETVNLAQGYGINMLDFNKADSGEDTEWDEASLEALSDRLANYDSLSANLESSLKSTMWGQRIATDCFGNIICMGYNHQYIAVPACMNPYVWQAVDADGNDVGEPGMFMNIINAKNIVQVDKGALKSVSSSGNYVGFATTTSFNSDDVMHITAVLDNYVKTTSGYNGIGTILSSSELVYGSGSSACIPARFVRGQGDYLVGSGLLFGSIDTAKTAVSNIVKGYNSWRPKDKTAVDAPVDSSGFWFWSEDYVPLIENVTKLADSSGGGYLGSRNSVNILDGYVFIDNLGVYKEEDGSDHDFSAFNVEHYIDPATGDPAGTIAGGIRAESDFGNHSEMILSGRLNSLESCTEQALSSIYVSYVYAYFYTEENKADTIGKIGYRFASENLPNPPSDGVDVELSGVMVDMELNAIRDWTYYLLHPTQGYNYVTTLLTNKLNHMLLGWHSDMVGTNGVGVTTGTTKYRSNVGYVTMPDLSEIEWTDKLISFYQDCIPFLIILIVVLMLFAYITGVLSLQRAIMAAVLFSAFLMIPTTLINGAVQQSNAISQRIYGEKFTYWAMVQQESYATQIDEAANSAGSSGNSTYENYLRTLYGMNQQVYSNQGMESVVLKWQAPKKMSSLVLSSEDAKSLTGLSDVGMSMLNGMLGRTYGGQSYVDDEDAVYMYRSYIDISNFSRYIYGGIDDGTVPSTDSPSSVSSILSGSFSNGLKSAVTNLPTTYEEYRNAGYTSWGDGESASNPNYDYITIPMSSQIMADAIRNSAGMESWDSKDDLVAINQDIFNFGVPMFTNSSMSGFDQDDFIATGSITGTERLNDFKDFYASYGSNKNAFVGLASYALYSENSFYYFSWKLYHDGLGYESSLYNTNGYKDLLLGQTDGGYFYMNEGNGGLKDFMDMKSLFTYIIPYMKECNDLVREWDDTYGIFIYEGVPTEEGHWGDVSGDAELTAKYWHNLNVSRLYCLYCPWVDVMYDCSYAQPETINVLGKKVTIEDPLNPASYPASRPMIFSEAEMKDYGLSEADLTKVEKLILQCNEDMQERMYELLNYYNFSDITLNTAAAMQCAFSFNINFSETGVMSDNHNIYPQSYDLANFSYDAFLRFILAESTGESLLDTSTTTGTSAGETTGDFYERVVNNSSTTTAIVLLVLDIISIYVLPAFKMFFLVAIFLSSILIVFVSLCKIEDNAKFLRKVLSGFLLPLIQFFAVTVAFSWVISLFMGKGNNSITQTDDLSISMGDPVIAILVIIAIDIIVLILYWKIIQSTLKDVKFNGKLALNFASGVVGAVGGMAVGVVTGAAGAVQGTKQFIDNRVDRHYEKIERKQLREYNKNGGATPDKPQDGTGVESSRAAQRGSASVDDRHDATPTHGTDPRKRVSTGGQGSGEDSDAKRQKIDNAAKSGAESMKRSGDKKPEAKKPEPKKPKTDKKSK